MNRCGVFGWSGYLRYSGVVERAVEDKEDDVPIGGPCFWNDAQNANAGGDGDEHGHAKGGAGVVEQEADEWNRDHTTHGKCNVEEVVDLLGFGSAVKEICVLRADGCNKVIDPQHLQDGEEGNEYEPGRPYLLRCRLSV